MTRAQKTRLLKKRCYYSRCQSTQRTRDNRLPPLADQSNLNGRAPEGIQDAAIRQPPILRQRSSQHGPGGMGCEPALRGNSGRIAFEWALPGNSGSTGRRGCRGGNSGGIGRRGCNSGRTGRRGRNSGRTGHRGRRFNVAWVRTQRRCI